MLIKIACPDNNSNELRIKLERRNYLLSKCRENMKRLENQAKDIASKLEDISDHPYNLI